MKHSDVTLLLVLLVSFVVATLSFALFVSTFFSRPTLAGPCSGVIYFVTYYVYQLVGPASYTDPTTASTIAGVRTSFLSPIQMDENQQKQLFRVV